MEFWADSEIHQEPSEHRTNLATLRADIERMGTRLREQDATPVQSGHEGVTDRDPLQGGKGGGYSPPPSSPQGAARSADPLRSPNAGGSSAVQSGQAEGYAQSASPIRRTKADKRRDVLALLDVEKSDNAPLTDREIARRAGVSPTTVGTIRRSLA